jgi:hypothetical protein
MTGTGGQMMHAGSFGYNYQTWNAGEWLPGMQLTTNTCQASSWINSSRCEGIFDIT